MKKKNNNHKIEKNWMENGNVFYVSVAQHLVQAIGGMEMNI